MLPAETFAERKALEATQLESFPLQLFEIRRTVDASLEVFGRSNIFAEYTVHSYAHVHQMLTDLDWIIPDITKTNLTKADWLMIVLAIYFHDLGLVVTEKEFEERNVSDFELFRDQHLFKGPDGADYKQKVDILGADKAERFYYQEFVRANHGKRVAAWIEGNPSYELGFAKSQIEEINRLFGAVSKNFRKDLAKVCESHNLDDIANIDKYKSFQPYGPTKDEACNLLYAAVILRSADLLQITRQRAPSIMFRLINPTDPLSQIEWTKQNSVTGVFVKDVKDKDGVTQKQEQSDTVAIFAKFDNENGFFGLTSYLAYAKKQLLHSYDVVKKAHPGADEQYVFPWKKINDDDVDAEGFDPTPFQFQIDQAKILDLLTGHTLYNDSSVAIRELVQNSLDAVRLFSHQTGTDPKETGIIKITYNTGSQSLTIQDNGTGMTQEIIERHLLNVGSSRYQEASFKEKNPNFHSISRFGIGVLSAFMVADDIQIITFSQDQLQGRQISLRSVHGKYLIRLLEKNSAEAQEVGSHGTKITIRIRNSSKKVQVEQALRQWIVLPRCNVTYSENGSAPATIGYRTPRAAIQDHITNNLFSEREDISVEEKVVGGISLAVAMRYNKHFRERTFIQYSNSSRARPSDVPPMGLCVEGIRVDFNTPALHQSQMMVLVDCCGSDAPKTNVSRSALESENSRSKINELIFSMYLELIAAEITRLQQEEKFSLSYATNQFPYIAGFLYQRQNPNTEKYKSFSDFPLLIVEDESGRQAVSINDLIEKGAFWTIESNAISSLMDLLKDVKADLTAKQVSDMCGFKGVPIPGGSLVTNIKKNWFVSSMIDDSFEICELSASIIDRRLDAKWALKSENPIWRRLNELESRDNLQIVEEIRSHRRLRENRSPIHDIGSVSIAMRSFAMTGLEQHVSVSVFGGIRFLPDTPLWEFFSALPNSTEPERIRIVLYCEAVAPLTYARRSDSDQVPAEIEYSLRDIGARFGERYPLDILNFMKAVKNCEGRLATFEPYGWSRME